ncbi:TonB-dependent receptor [Sphingomonas sp. AAP5]|uniref:TonB-dependent receptor n=1 Tax=Sphingomonas sp. AAP5 TaxID=1523415 RepID=UPI0010575EE1|nr:TonB-dependent receptor [Sphingomonas sp. AAP5]QBM75064.1 TonB-dependent receptor [Sphingomonas sp. AAP5]
MKSNSVFAVTGVSFAALALSLASGASAQTAPVARGPAPATPSADDGGLQDIIVTAQKREQVLNDVPMSITAASGDKLARQGVKDVADLAKVVPGFSYTESAYATPVFTLRGIGFYDTSLGAKPTVGVYLDQVPLPFSILTRGATLDLERVEVLKGPQGTLFGSNATGGAINYIAAKPTNVLKAGLDAGVDNFGKVDLGGFISGPLSDTLTARISARTEQGGAWQRSYTRDAKLGDSNFSTGRLLLDFKPTDKVSFELNLNGFIDKSDGQAAQLIGVVPLGNPARLGALATYPVAPANDRAADWSPGQEPKRDNWFYQASLHANVDVADQLRLVSITAYSRYHHDTDVDPDGVASRDYFYNTVGTITSFSQELRLEGKIGDRLTYIVGGNYAREKVFQQDNAGPYNDATSAYQLVDAGLSPVPFFVYAQYSNQTFSTKAAFANVDYKLGDKVTLHGGIRYTDTSIDYAGCTADRGFALGQGIQNLLNFIRGGAGLAPIAIPANSCVTINSATLTVGEVRNRLSQDNISWRAGIDYKPSRDLLLYVSASRGYKSGSFPILSASDANQLRPVTQESVLAYEAGVKATLGRRAQLNAAVFYYDYSDKQLKGRVVATPDVFGPLEALVNVPKSSVKGAEIQLDLAPVRGFNVSLAGTYIDTKIRRSFSNYDSYGNVRDFSGSAFPYTPKFQGVADAQYEWKAGDGIAPFIGGSVSYQSATKAVLGDATLTPSAALTALGGLDIDSYALVDLRAGASIGGKKYRVTVFVRNLFDTYYWTNATRITDTTVRFAGRPRTFGVSLSARL